MRPLRLPLVLASLAVAGLAAAALPVGRVHAEPPAEPSLLERLSADVARVAARASSTSGRLTAGNEVLDGVLVGQPARFVVALGAPLGSEPALPARGTLRVAGRPAVEAALLQADAELGLAIYAPESTDLPSLDLARAQPPAGSLGVALGAEGPDLLVLPTPGHELENLVWGGRGGATALCGADGRLVALATGQGERTSCATCHMTTPRQAYASAVGLSLDPETQRLRLKMPEYFASGPTSCPQTHWTPLRAVAGEGGQPGYLAARFGTPVAVPAAVIARALEDVAAGAGLARAYLGVVPADARTDLALVQRAAQLEFLDPSGALRARMPAFPTAEPSGVALSKVLEGSPAARAGLEQGATILSIDGVALRGSAHLARVLARRRPGETLRLGVQGRNEAVSVTLGDRDKEARRLVTTASIGLDVQPLTAEMALWLGVVLSDGGLVVRNVTPGSVAAAAGLQRGDVLRAGGGGPLRDAAELDAVLGAARGTVELVGSRGSEPLTVKIVLPVGGAPSQRSR